MACSSTSAVHLRYVTFSCWLVPAAAADDGVCGLSAGRESVGKVFRVFDLKCLCARFQCYCCWGLSNHLEGYQSSKCVVYHFMSESLQKRKKKQLLQVFLWFISLINYKVFISFSFSVNFSNRTAEIENSAQKHFQKMNVKRIFAYLLAGEINN